MKRKTVLLTAVAASMAVTTPAMAWIKWPSQPRPPSTSSSGGNGSTGGSTQVPEPGMLGMMGAALIGLSLVRRRKSRD